MKIPLTRVVIGEEEASAARRAILSGWVTQGPEVAAFEREFASLVGSPHACAVSNCTAALHVALAVLGIGPGDEVVTVSHSFIATANSIRYTGARPVFVDVERGTGNLDPAQLERAVSPHTRAILTVHQAGMPCDLSGILEFAHRHGIPVIEDCACAIGSEIRMADRWEKLGKPHGTIACFSFHPRKVITTGDGGMLTTGSAELDAKFRLLRQHGMSVPDTKRHGSPEVIFETYDMLGYNYRMTDIQAAVGREQIKRLPEIVAGRRTLVERYRKLLAGSGLEPDREPAWGHSNWQSLVATLPEGICQRTFMQSLLDRGVATRRGIMCSHRELPYAGSGEYVGRLANSEYRQERTIILPLYPQMTEPEMDYVVTAINEVLATMGRSR